MTESRTPGLSRQCLLWGALCGVLFLVTRLGVSLIAIDETRYAGVAWEMWRTGQWLVPHMNGMPYPDKPPLLFWLINLGWAFTGANLTWLRLLPALISLSCLGLVNAMARELWPDRPRVAWLAPLVLGSTLMWALATPLVMFDIVLSACILVALYGTLIIGRAPALGGLLTTSGVALGILAKGPVALLPIGLLVPAAPWLLGLAGPGRRLRWTFASIVAGIGLALAWAGLAADAGGSDYANAIFWQQTAGRVSNAFAHQRPVWWYLPLLPLLLFPWLCWPSLWVALARLPFRTSPPLRWLIWWVGVTFAIFCLISAKQPHYLMPLLPAFALLVAIAIDTAAVDQPAQRIVLPGSLIAGLAILLFLVRVTRSDVWPDEMAWYSIFAPLALAALAIGLMAGRHGLVGRTLRLALCGWLFVVLAIALIAPPVIRIYETDRAATAVARIQRAARPVGYVGNYENQFQFMGRLTRPVAEVDKDNIDSWAKTHRDGVIVMYCRDNESGNFDLEPLYTNRFRFRSGWLTFWPAALLMHVDAGC